MVCGVPVRDPSALACCPRHACMHARARSGLSSQHCRLRPPTKPRLRHTQGCNLALESVRVFAATLDASGSNLDVTPGAFTAARLNDVRAMQDIEYMQVCREMGGRHAPGATQPAARPRVLRGRPGAPVSHLPCRCLPLVPHSHPRPSHPRGCRS